MFSHDKDLECKLIQGSDLPETQFVRLMNPDFVHNGFQWRLGENTDIAPFKPRGQCKKGGLYFTTLENLMSVCFIPPSTDKLLDHFLVDVTVSADEPVWSETNVKWKAHTVTITNPRRIRDFDVRTRLKMFFGYDDPTKKLDQLLIYPVQRYYTSLAMLEPELETEAMVTMAISSDSGALQFVRHQTLSICCHAANINQKSIEFIRLRVMKQNVILWLLKQQHSNQQ